VATKEARPGTRAGTLAWLDGDRFRAFPLPAKVCADRIEALAEDPEGGLWIGTELCGLHRVSDRPFRTLTTEDGLPSDRVLGLAADGEGGVLAGTRGGGLARVRPGATDIELLRCPAGLPCEECWDFSAGARSAAFWTVCKQNVVLRWDGRAMSRFAPLPGELPAASFVLEASDGAIWFALENKVVRWQGGQATSIAAPELFGVYRILFEGQDRTMWIGADDGLALWRAGQTRIVRLPPADRPAEVANFYQDGQGTLWMATKGEGIRRARADGDGIATIGAAHGLPTGWIVQLLEDGQGRLWASSSKGIFWVEKRELEEVAEGRRQRVNPSLYDASDGIQMRWESFGHPAGFKDGQGRLWFATNSGIAVVDPAGAARPPRVIVSELRLGGERVPLRPGPVPVVTGGSRDLEVAFSALSFAPPDTVSFRYRLGLVDADPPGHDDWIELGGSRTLHHARLEPGEYRLALQARTRDGGWSGEPTRLGFRLRPPFHRSLEFVLLAAVAGALVLLGVHRMRIARTRAGLQAVMAERARIAREIHDTLAQAFVATSVQLECLEEALEGEPRAPGAIRRHLGTAKKVVEESLDEARRAVWALRPQAVEPGLVPALETLVNNVSGGTVVELQVAGVARPLPPLVASNLLRIAHEAVANAHRHAHARRIELRLGFTARSVTLSVTDDGKGLPAAGEQAGGAAPEPPGVAQGILGMKERAAEMGGSLSIAGAPQRGTTVLVEVAA
jgi:signal transduction histidine kinase